MHRPFYSLAVLLELIALSLVLVSSARSQTATPIFEKVARAAHSAEQDARRQWADICSSIVGTVDDSDLIGSNEMRDSLPWSAASESSSQSLALTGTGYDGDYDFAMFDGVYNGVELSHADIENSMAAVNEQEAQGEEEVGSSPIEVFTINCPATSLHFDDYECCVDAGFGGWTHIEPRAGGASRGDVSWCGEAEGWVEASASSDEVELADEHAVETWQQLGIALDRATEVAQVMWQGCWRPVTQQRLENWMTLAASYDEVAVEAEDPQLTWWQLNVALDRSVEVAGILWHGRWAPFISLSTANETVDSLEQIFEHEYVSHVEKSVSTLTYREEVVVLVQAASTLDQMGLMLQQVAQELRYRAADRIVSRGTTSRVARRAE